MANAGYPKAEPGRQVAAVAAEVVEVVAVAVAEARAVSQALQACKELARVPVSETLNPPSGDALLVTVGWPRWQPSK
jgi:hypothetical protein